jgi:hypothetical protein
MAEIKSTLDLVLEKTKHLTLSAEEKAEMQLQDALKKISAYVEKILERVLSPEELRQKIEALPQNFRERVRQETVRHLIQALNLSTETDPLAATLEVLAEPALQKPLAEVIRCRSAYRQARNEAQQTARHRILAELAGAGIRGSAVVAKLESDSSWRAEDDKLRHPCEQRLAVLRQDLA